MICYKGITFCSANCSNEKCHRNVTEEVKEGGKKWWGSEDFPIALSDFSKGCPDFIEKRNQKGLRKARP